MPGALINPKDKRTVSVLRDWSAICPNWACSVCLGTNAASATEDGHEQLPGPQSRTSLPTDHQPSDHVTDQCH